MIKWLPLYGIYLFISGWASLDSYYRFFGMDPKSLDIGLYDTLVRGFTILFPVPHFSFTWLVCGPVVLWFLYAAVVVVSVESERRAPLATSAAPKFAVARFRVIILIALLLSIFFVAFKAGEDRARLDKTDDSTLPTILFQIRDSGRPAGSKGTETQDCADGDGATYHGRLLLLRNGTYFIHGVAVNPCAPTGNLQLSIYRAEDLKEVYVTEYQ